MTREQMMDNVCKWWGLEHPYTIGFCRMAEDEDCDDDTVLDHYSALLSMSIEEDD